MPADHPDTDLLLLADADRRLVRAVDGLDAATLAGPSLLPGWSRAHVVAHLALNAEALIDSADAVREQRPAVMYPSQEQRDADVLALAEASTGELRDRLLAATTRFGEAAEAVPADFDEVPIERTPGGPTFPASELVGRRLREVEIHHADLDVGYTAADWSEELARRVVEFRSSAHRGPAFVAHATDVDQQWRFGSDPGTDVPRVSGPVRVLAWWATGRGDGDGLSGDDGRVPRIDPW